MRTRPEGRFTRALLMTAVLTTAMPVAVAHADDLSVVASIGPVHSLVSSVMEGVGEPHLLVPGGASPHTYALRPSDAAALESADAVFWVGQNIETFLDGPLDSLAAGRDVALMHADGLQLLEVRSGGVWEAHAHHDHDHHGHDHGHADHDDGHDHHDDDHDEAHDHDDHGHDHDHDEAHDHDDDDHDHDHDEAHDHHDDDHGHDDDHDHADHGHDHHDHDGLTVDGHVWLDPINALAMVDAIEQGLSQAAPDHAAQFAANADALRTRLEALDRDLAATLEPVSTRPFIVFHDAYQYFETRYGLAGVGSITLGPEIQPGAQRLSDLRDRLARDDVTCVFQEPQFEPRLVSVVVEGTDVQVGTLDPLGADITPGPDAYFDLMRAMADSLADCLSTGG